MKSQVIIIRIDPKTKVKASVMAKKSDITLSEYIRNLILTDLNKKK